MTTTSGLVKVHSGYPGQAKNRPNRPLLMTICRPQRSQTSSDSYVPVADDCPMCGQTMFKKSGKGFKKPFCINEKCENFTPEEKRSGWKKKPALLPPEEALRLEEYFADANCHGAQEMEAAFRAGIAVALDLMRL